GLSGAAVSNSQINLSWTDNSSNEDGFNVERSTDAVNWTPIATTTGNATSYSDTGLATLTAYYHRVRAFNRGGGYSGYTNVATTTTTDVPPSAPSGLSRSQAPGAASTTDLTLNWTDNSSNELGFQIERDSGSGFTQIATTSANATNYTDASLPTGLYFYRV